MARRLSTKQILPTEPEPYARQQVTDATLTQRTPAAHAAVLEQFKKASAAARHSLRPVQEGTVIFPGFDGGGEYGAAEHGIRRPAFFT